MEERFTYTRFRIVMPKASNYFVRFSCPIFGVALRYDLSRAIAQLTIKIGLLVALVMNRQVMKEEMFPNTVAKARIKIVLLVIFSSHIFLTSFFYFVHISRVVNEQLRGCVSLLLCSETKFTCFVSRFAFRAKFIHRSAECSSVPPPAAIVRLTR